MVMWITAYVRMWLYDITAYVVMCVMCVCAYVCMWLLHITMYHIFITLSHFHSEYIKKGAKLISTFTPPLSKHPYVYIYSLGDKFIAMNLIRSGGEGVQPTGVGNGLAAGQEASIESNKTLGEILAMEGYTKQSTIILSTYRKQWGLRDVLRELKTNAYDATKVWIKLTGSDTPPFTIVSDEGNGLTLGQLLYLGANEYKALTDIGQFGEGLKVSMAVTLRLGLKATIRAKDYEVKISGEEPLFPLEDNAKVLTFWIKKGLPEVKGTTITIDGLSLSDAKAIEKDLFLEDIEGSTLVKAATSILKDEYKGKLYCKGVFVQDLPKALFGYNMNNLKLNTDRQATSINEILRLIAYDLDAIDSVEIAKLYLKRLTSTNDCLEMSAQNIYLNVNFAIAWKELGLPYLTNNSNIRGQMSHRGRQVLVLPEAWVNTLSAKGIVTAEKFLQLEHEQAMKAKRKGVPDWSEDKVSTMTKALEVIDSAELFSIKVNTQEMLDTLRIYQLSDNIEYPAFYDKSDKTINIRADQFDSLATIASDMTHELIHKIEGYDDATVSFEHSLDSKISKLFAYLIDKTKASAQFEQKMIDNNGQVTITVPPKFVKKLSTERYYKVKVTPIGE